MARSQRYLEHFLRRLRELARRRGVLTAADLDRIVRSERARTGGEVRAERQRAASGVAADDYGMAPAYVPVTMPDADDDDPDLDDIADVFGLLEIEGSFQDSIEDVCEALKATYGDQLVVVATFPDRVIYGACDVAEDDEFTLYSQAYTTDAAGTVHLQGRQEVGLEADSFKPQPDAMLADDPQPPKDLSPKQQSTWRKFYANMLKRCKDDPDTCKQKAASAASKMVGNIKHADTAGGIRLAGGNAGNPAALIQWFNDGADGAIDWGQSGDFDQCVSVASQHMDGEQAKGFCNERHQDAVGGPPGSEDVHAAEGITPAVVTLADTTEKPWDGSASRFPDATSYCKSALIDDNPPGKPKQKQNCALPVREPDGTLNLNAVRAAASALGGGRGGLKGWSAQRIAEAKTAIDRLEKQYKIGPYADGGTKAADSAASLVLHEDDAGRVRWVEPATAAATPAVALGDPAPYFTLAAVRLADATGGLPEWQQVHKLGEWSEPHASGTRIQLSRAMGTVMIRNYHANVIRRRVPLDEIHLTDQGGRALGWMADLRWGAPGQGLPGTPEPDGTGPVLYGRFRYNALGQQMLGDEQYAYLSPQYHLDYVDKESGQHYGPAIVAVAATNNPFLRQRSIQGEEAPPVAVLTDGLARPQGAVMAGSNGTTPAAAGSVSLEDKVRRLEEEREQERAELQRERAERHQEQVDTFLADQVSKGYPPALAAIARPLLLGSSPRAEAVISLGDGDAAVQVNPHEAIRRLVSETAKMPLGRVTLADSTRPGEGGSKEKTVDDYFAEGKARARALGISGAAAVVTVPSED